MTMLKNISLLILSFFILTSCGENKKQKVSTNEPKEITIYTHRHYDSDKTIIANFEKETGIKVNVVKAKADELLQKLEAEGKQSPADLLLTIDAGRLVRAKQKDLLQSAKSEIIGKSVPENLRDEENFWFSLTKRARIIVYDKNKVNPEDLSTYEDLTNPKWNGKVLIRSSSNIYNQSLLASIIANNGQDSAKQWAEGLVQNMARKPKGNDRDQVKAILAGEGEIGIINTYYLGKLINSKDSLEVEAGNSVGVFFLNQQDRGAHINVSGIGVTKHAPNKEGAIQFIEYLVSKEVQEIFAKANYEYPVNKEASASELLKSWGDFKEDNLPLSKLGELNKNAVVIFDEVAWDKGPDVQ